MIYRVRERTLRTGCGAGVIQRGSDAGLMHTTDYRRRNDIVIQELNSNAQILNFGVSSEIN